MQSRGALAALLAGLATLAAACASTPGAIAAHAPVDVLYAASLTGLMESQIGPAFSSASGDTFTGYAAGSDALVSEIKAGVHPADVFLSASPEPNAELEGSANGDHESWYLSFATAPLVLAYNPQSRFAARLRTEPWYDVVVQAGIRVGRTDPTLDPKGALTAQAVQTASTTLHRPDLDAALSTWPVFPEETLVGRLEAGELDAGFFYSFEATAQGLPAVALTGVHLGASFTVTILNRAPHPAAAAAFVAFLLRGQGRGLLEKAGLSVGHVALSGAPGSVPATLRSLVGG
jgi:molybdate/tungstate transport system substrate-binding protein